MKVSKTGGRWLRILGVLLVVLGALIAIRDLTAGVSINLMAFVALIVGIAGVLLSRRTQDEERETPA